VEVHLVARLVQRRNEYLQVIRIRIHLCYHAGDDVDLPAVVHGEGMVRPRCDLGVECLPDPGIQRGSTAMKSRLTLLLLLCLGANAQAQAPGPGGRGPAPTPDPVVTPIPSIAPITGAGEVYDSAAALWEGYGLEEFDYVVEEYRI